MVELNLTVHSERYALTKLAGGSKASLAVQGRFAGVLRLGEELTVVTEARLAPQDGETEGDFLLIEIEGPFALDSTGIVAAVSAPLAAAGVSLFAFSVWSTDAFLLKDADLPRARQALLNAGHRIRSG